MANIHEITRNLIQMRGEVKAATITADEMTKTAMQNPDRDEVRYLLDALEFQNSIKFTGTIWFESGSYAYLDKDGAGYYWSFVQVPPIPDYLKK